MVIAPADRDIARQMFVVAMSLIVARNGVVEAQAALDDPCPATLRALLEAGRGQPWLRTVHDVMIEVGVAGAEEVLEPTRWEQLLAAGGRLAIGVEKLTDDEVAIMLLSQVAETDDDDEQ